jgi:transposase-like protein
MHIIDIVKRQEAPLMPSNRSKYTPEFREQTARHIIETGKSATAMAEELAIDINTVCRWVRDFRKKHDMPTWVEEKRRRHAHRPEQNKDLIWENKKLAKEVSAKNKLIEILQEEKAILKKSLAIFAQPHT